MALELLAPLPKLLFTDSNGNPLSGGKLFTYAAGSTTKQNTYTDSTGATPNANPIILDSRGECNCWLDSQLTYKFTLSPSTDTDPPTNPIWTVDNIQAGSLPNWAIATGTADAITASYGLRSTGLVDGLLLGFRATAANATGTPTFSPDGLGPYTITKGGGGVLAASDIPGNFAEVLLRFKASPARFELVNPYPNAAVAAQPIGSLQAWPGIVLPNANWDWADGGTLSRATYATLFAALMTQATIAVTIASPAVVTWNSHGLRTNSPVKFFTTGALPTGITAGTHGAYVGTSYYVKVIDANTFNIAATPGGANINTSGAQSGTHTGVCAPWGDGDGVTTFHKPDMRGRIPVGRDDQGSNGAASRITSGISGILGNVQGAVGGDQKVATHTISLTDPTHIHTQNAATAIAVAGASWAAAAGPNLAFGGSTAPAATGITASDTTPNNGGVGANVPPTSVADWIIKIQ